MLNFERNPMIYNIYLGRVCGDRTHDKRIKSPRWLKPVLASKGLCQMTHPIIPPLRITKGETNKITYSKLPINNL